MTPSPDEKPFRVAIAEPWFGYGQKGEQIGNPIEVNGMWWTPVLWDGEDDPSWFKSEGLEKI